MTPTNWEISSRLLRIEEEEEEEQEEEEQEEKELIFHGSRVIFCEGLAHGLSSSRMMFRHPLTVVNLSIVFAFLAVAASTTTTCDPQFDDVPSRTLTSAVVFQGSVTRSRTVAGDDERHGTSNTTLSVVQLRVTSVWKGGVTSSQTVTVIGECSLDTEVGATYFVFAVAARNGWSELDDGELYGVLGRPVPSSRRVTRQVNDYVQTAGTRPRVRLRPRGSTLDVGDNGRVRVQCRGSGRPTPHYLWTKDDSLLQSSRHLQIKQQKRGSRLEIRRATAEDSGVYKCRAVNVVGNSSVKAIRVNVGQSQPSTTTEKVFSRLCQTQHYCLNGGTCYIMIDIGRMYCECQEGYDGNRCEERVVRPPLPIKTKADWLSQALPSPVILIILLSGILLVVFLAVVVTVTCLIRNRCRREAARKDRAREQLIRNGIASSNAARISEHRGNAHVNVLEMTSFPVSVDDHQLADDSHKRAPATSIEVDHPNNSRPPAGPTSEDRNHTDVRSSPFRARTEAPASTIPVTSQQPSSAWPRYTPEPSHEPHTQVPAGTGLQRHSFGYPIDSDPEASVV